MPQMAHPMSQTAFLPFLLWHFRCGGCLSVPGSGSLLFHAEELPRPGASVEWDIQGLILLLWTEGRLIGLPFA